MYKSIGGHFLDDRRDVLLMGDPLTKNWQTRLPVTKRVQIIGAGLAGSEAAWQCARRGIPVDLFEMRPVRTTPAHQTADFAELVCSDSLKSESENTAPGYLKEEMQPRRISACLNWPAKLPCRPGMLLPSIAPSSRRKVTEAISREPLIHIRREEAVQIDIGQHHHHRHRPSDFRRAFARKLHASARRPAGDTHLFFYDSISPIVGADSIDMSKVYLAARYDKGSADYINCPMSRDEYDTFY